MKPLPKSGMMLITAASLTLYIGLAVLGWGGWSAFMAHPTRAGGPLSAHPPSQLSRPAARPLRWGPGLPQRDRRPGPAPAAPAARRAHELRGGPARVGVRRAVLRLSSAHLAAAAVPLLR